jgi:hypothetical protein
VKIVNPDHLTVESIDTKGVSEELQQQIDGVRGAFPVAEPSTFFGGFKKLFQ